MEGTATSTLARKEEGARPVESPPDMVETRHFRELPPIASDDQPPPSRRIISEGRIVFLLALGSYFTVASLLDFKYKIFPADAFSRMANGFYVLYSSDPHLAAIGFVWEPLQSMADLVFLLGNHLWPALSHDEMAGCLVSALAMAGAVYQMCAALREWGVSRTPRLVLTAFFALDPMIVYYGGNGMSEALYLFTLITSTRYLLRWMHNGDLRSLAYSAVALGFCYLTRNEAALAALFGALAVGVVSYRRSRGRRASRVRTGVSDSMIFGIPAFTAALGWAIVSYVIIGQFLDGGALSVRLAHQNLSHSTLHSRLLYEFHAVGALAPFLPILLRGRGICGLQEEGSRGPGACCRARRRAGLRHVVAPEQRYRQCPPVLDRCTSARHPAPRVPGGGATDACPISGRRWRPNPTVTSWRPWPRRTDCSLPGAGGHDPDRRFDRIRHGGSACWR